MLFWKVFAVLDVLVQLGYWRALLTGRERAQPFDIITIPVALIGTFGVICYAFSRPTLPPSFWPYFLPVLIGVAGWEIAKVINKSERNIETLIAVALVVTMVGLTSVAVYRLGGSVGIGVLGV